MLKLLFTLISILIFIQTPHAQKKYINRKVAQKNYDGYMLMKEAKYDSALLLFNSAIKDDPEAFFIYQNRAICRLHLKDTLNAINDYQTNIKLEPDNIESKYALGNIYKYRKDSINAIKHFVQAISQADEEFSQKKLLYMNNFVGNYYRLNEVFDSALVFYNRVKSYTPQNPSVFINSAVCNFKLDSLEQYCADLEQAFVLGGDVNCIALKAYCKGCSHLLDSRGNTDTTSTALDIRLSDIIPDTIYYHAPSKSRNAVYTEENNRKVKVYYNKLWQICLPAEASFYREAFWAKGRNFYGGQFKDYYENGTIYAIGTIDKGKLDGPYKVYYSNGNPKLSGAFVNGLPNGKWTYFLKDGSPDYEVNITLDEFKVTILNKDNPNYPINSGTGQFNILLDQWDKIKFIFSGEYLNNTREGQWTYEQNGEKIISEKYKQGKFRSGYVSTNVGNVKIKNSHIGASIFIPPHVTQVAGLQFTTIEAVNFYGFIKIYGF
uniref:hypothetical protein n=1 Tax=uncultured Draconibacterium sp. TaxID=1573823 RepID=UPI003216CAF9